MENENEFLDAPENNMNNDDELHIGLKILSFCIPLAGAIIYFTTNERYPNKKQQACYAALIGMGVGLVLRVITTMMGG
jgi:hypothetical protein